MREVVHLKRVFVSGLVILVSLAPNVILAVVLTVIITCATRRPESASNVKLVTMALTAL